MVFNWQHWSKNTSYIIMQDHATQNQPNHAVLKKLRQEMVRLRERDAAVMPVGTLLVTESLPEHSGSNLDNVHI